MGIFSRTRDIVAANVNDMLDRAEDPAKMIRMIIMEMEETLVEVRASAAHTIADQKEMRRHITKLEKLGEGWTEKAELALSKDREDLARAALQERSKAHEMIEQLDKEYGILEESLRSSEDDIAKLQSKLLEAKSRQNGLIKRLESAEHRVRMREMYNGEKVRDAFARFEYLERKVDMAEGRADAMNMGENQQSLESQIAALETDDKLDADLAALKKSVGKGKN